MTVDIKSELAERVVSYHYAVLLFLPSAGAVVSLTYAVLFYWAIDHPLSSFFCLLHALCYLLTFVFVANGRVHLARHFLTVNFLFQVAEHALYLFPLEAYFQIYFFVGMPLIYMLFSNRQSKVRTIYSLLSIGLLLVTELWRADFPLPYLFEPAQIALVRNANVISSLLVLVGTIYLYVHLMERAEEVTRQQAISDPLTGLFNRRYFLLLAEHFLKLGQRSGMPHALLFIDLDDFKQINDRYGHDVGDQVLRQVGEVLQGGVRHSDVVARYGGEEFVMFLADASELAAIDRAEELREAIQKLPLPRGLSLSASIGMTWARNRESDLADLIRRADKAMYEAKRQGKDRVVLVD